MCRADRQCAEPIGAPASALPRTDQPAKRGHAVPPASVEARHPGEDRGHPRSCERSEVRSDQRSHFGSRLARSGRLSHRRPSAPGRARARDPRRTRGDERVGARALSLERGSTGALARPRACRELSSVSSRRGRTPLATSGDSTRTRGASARAPSPRAPGGHPNGARR
jgi:hypothetical protein